VEPDAIAEPPAPDRDLAQVTAILQTSRPIGPINPRLFGGFVEHMGRCVYGGLYDPGHPLADEDGFRSDVLELVRELGVTVVRYPGGNFVSGYRWEDGVGPVDERPTRLDLAWHSLETNAFGLDEFIRWARKAGVEPMLALNLGTRGVQEALDLLEYANHPGGTTLSDLRIRNGSAQPHGVRLWCLGNEMDGPWQLGHKTAYEYARLAAETARAMRQVDPELELVACGSSEYTMPTFGTWEQTVLAEAGPLIDHLSLHFYAIPNDTDPGSFLGSSAALDRFISRVVALVDEAKAAQHLDRTVQLSLDEWNVWYNHELVRPTEWLPAPRLSEEAYTVADAVVVGSMLITLLQHADRVTSACLAQLVNTIAPIRSEPGGEAWRQASFYPFSLTARMARGVALRLSVIAPTMRTSEHGEISAVDAVAADDPGTGRLAVFIVNRDPSRRAAVQLDLSAAGAVRLETAAVLWDADRAARNTPDNPSRVTPNALDVRLASQGRPCFELPPASWAMLSFAHVETGETL
jgi:alpha-L-arabinofuranosidase